MSALLEAFPWATNPTLIVAQAMSGVTTAVLITLVALGISLIFGVARIINLAHGSFYMLGAYLMSYFSPMREGLTWFAVSLVCSAVIVGMLGAVFEATLLRKIYRKGPHLQMMLTFGMVLCINSAVELIWGTEFRSVERPEAISGSLNWGDVIVPKYNLMLIGLSISLLILLWLFVSYSNWGRNIRASSVDRDMLGALGVNINNLSTQVFTLASALAGLAGALSAPLFAVSLQIGFDNTLSSFVVVVIGGLGNLLGVMVAALVVAQSQAFGILIAPKFAGFIPYVLMLIVLLVRYGKSSYVYGTETSVEETRS